MYNKSKNMEDRKEKEPINHLIGSFTISDNTADRIAEYMDTLDVKKSEAFNIMLSDFFVKGYDKKLENTVLSFVLDTMKDEFVVLFAEANKNKIQVRLTQKNVERLESINSEIVKWNPNKLQYLCILADLDEAGYSFDKQKTVNWNFEKDKIHKQIDSYFKNDIFDDTKTVEFAEMLIKAGNEFLNYATVSEKSKDKEKE